MSTYDDSTAIIGDAIEAYIATSKGYTALDGRADLAARRLNPQSIWLD